ncbi:MULTISPECIES: Os1348 family NHLP clan protein [Nitrospirillum]|uniref:Uncharacterized protein n=1 Tax=Nitrospirillum amazonense TaxID=28077 RepID=A0A560HB04_9PROT|nr:MULTISPECIES: Os1348 family NHLP clan protein [Nitrospirillum]MDZ5650688.1 Os1348 family NHLP clan protein [Nitrospirillum sp. BR 11828]TWB43517.1 hypothetical protein FBZ90_105330 [Nitrospirillum amazonense]
MTQFLTEMTPEDVQKVLGRALLEPGFRKQLLADPKGTLAILGYKASAEALAFFAKLGDQAFGNAADDLAAHIASNPLPDVWY